MYCLPVVVGMCGQVWTEAINPCPFVFYRDVSVASACALLRFGRISSIISLFPRPSHKRLDDAHNQMVVPCSKTIVPPRCPSCPDVPGKVRGWVNPADGTV